MCKRAFPISIHAPLRGRLIELAADSSPSPFQSTPPCGGDGSKDDKTAALDHFNPRPLAGATGKNPQPCHCRSISIHAPLRGRQSACGFSALPVRISIHAPLRGRPMAGGVSITMKSFQSTPPCGGDSDQLLSSPGPPDFNPRPLAGATSQAHEYIHQGDISIHAPLRGRLP